MRRVLPPCTRQRGALNANIKATRLDALIARGAPTGELADAAAAKGYRTLADDGIRRVLEGITTLEEISRVVDLTDRLA